MDAVTLYSIIIVFVFFFGSLRIFLVLYIGLKWNKNVHEYRLNILNKKHDALPSYDIMHDQIGHPGVMMLKFWCWSTKSFFGKDKLGAYYEICNRRNP